LKPAATVLAVCGGVGGAKLALGLQHLLPAGELAVVVNTGDDFDHLGLRICPDLDTVLYTLAGVVHPQQGWGRAEETFGFMDELRRQGGPEWFLLGDRDLVVHVERTRRLAAGERLTQIMADLAQRFGVASRILPMTDSPVATLLETDAGQLEFQHYFVRLRCEPAVRRLSFAGAPQAQPTPELTAVLRSTALRAIVLCPSNPFLSIDPVLAVPGLRAALRAARVPIVAVSPLIGGLAVKGPTAKIMRELGLGTDTAAILRHYASVIDGLIIDPTDAEEGAEEATTRHACAEAGVALRAEPTLMRSLADRVRVAEAALSLADSLRSAADARRAS
jgi:LPPG:FO 2-phospho-L-lactate transferase